MYGKTLKGIWIEKYGPEEGYRKWEEYKNAMKIRRRKEFIIDWTIIKNTFCTDIKKYRRLVDKYVRRLDVSILFGYQFQGKLSKDNHTWQLDHIISIKYGFMNNIDPKLIGSIENLRFIPRRHNNRKGESITTNDNYDGHLNRLSHELLVNWFGLPKLKRIS